LSTALEAGRVPTARALIIARQMLTGLGEAHRLGIVHRDVKPQNVMLVDVNGLEVVKLFDFGIASNDRAALKLTAPGTAFGTPEYIAPEQAMGQKVDARADVYGVGVVLFEMATGRLPFQSEDDLGYLRAHIKQPPPAPSAVAADAQLSRAFDAIVLKAMQKEPEARFETAEAMIAAIDKAAGHRPLQASGGKRGGARNVVMLLILLALAVVILHFAHLL
jgi:eukaryotic-like serine/threonine-protein kinase